MDETSTVLLVEADPAERDRLAEVIEETGSPVLVCPGPGAPDYTCIGSREGACPLVDVADVVVLDMATEAEALMTGVASEELLALYLLTGRRVIALGSYPAESIPGDLVRLRRHPARTQLLRALRYLLPAEEPTR